MRFLSREPQFDIPAFIRPDEAADSLFDMACGRARPTARVGDSAIGRVWIISKPEASAKLKMSKTLLFLGATVIVAHNLEEAFVAPHWLSQWFLATNYLK